MSNKSPYEILGVPRNATSEQIRRAYLLKVKEIHPDNFDQVKQRARWELANEQLKEINQAYTILKDEESRANYDRGAPTDSPPPRRQRSPDWDIKLGTLKAGMAWYANLPKSVQDRILERTAGTEKNQSSIPLAGIGKNYFFLVLLLAWFFVLINGGQDPYRWHANGQEVLPVGTLICAVLQAWNLCCLFRWHKSVLRPHLIITPLYVIRTGFDRIWYWPIWSVTAVRATHNYTNSAYTSTDLEMEFGEDKQSFTIRPQETYAHLCAMMNIFGRRVDTAKAQDDVRYFHDQDDFREIDPDKPPEKPEGFFLRNSTIWVITVIVYVLAYAAADGINREKPERAPRRASSNSRSPARTYLAEAPAVVQPTYPEYALPDNGATWVYGNQPKVAPFEITAPFGASCIAKLVDANTGRSVVSIFVRAGSTVTIDVPLGNYVLKYAMGDKWYGETHLFGPSTSYGKANTTLSFGIEVNRYTGHSIRLQKSVGGNLRTLSLSPEEF